MTIASQVASAAWTGMKGRGSIRHLAEQVFDLPGHGELGSALCRPRMLLDVEQRDDLVAGERWCRDCINVIERRARRAA